MAALAAYWAALLAGDPSALCVLGAGLLILARVGYGLLLDRVRSKSRSTKDIRKWG